MLSVDEQFELMLKAAYAYYWLDDPIMPDYEYDRLTQQVAQNVNNIDHPKKDLVDFEALKTCSSLFYIPKRSYDG